MPLWIAAAEYSLYIPMAGSLKDRRQVVRSIIDGVRSRFSMSAADLGPCDSYQTVSPGFAAAGSSSSELDERLLNLDKFLCQREEYGEFEITGFSQEVIKYGDIPN